jgi:hypothetical protein
MASRSKAAPKALKRGKRALKRRFPGITDRGMLAAGVVVVGTLVAGTVQVVRRGRRSGR